MPRFTRFAKGRRPSRIAGKKNKTEEKYAAELELRRRAGEVEWYAFEAFKVRLASGTFYTPDFAVMLPDGTLQCHEVKAGRVSKESGDVKVISEDTSRVKIKVAADLYPFEFLYAIEKPKKSGGGFELRQIGGDE